VAGDTAPAILLPEYQRRWLADKSRFKIGMVSRQSGKTFCTTLEIVDDTIEAMTEQRASRWVILSRGERQAAEAMDEGIKKHLQAYRVGFEAADYEWVDGETRVKALEVSLPHGSRITALPSNPDTARGFTANAFLDEFAFHKQSREIWRALFPVVSKRGLKLRVTSTPNGKGNKFFELITGPGIDRVLPLPPHLVGTVRSVPVARWSRHIVDIHRAVAEGLDRDIDELREALGDEDAWAQEYELKFLDEASAWLSYELIDAVEHPLAGEPDIYAGGPCFVGVDIGRRQDLFVIWVWEQVGDVLWCREIIELKRATFARQDEALDDVFRRYRVLRCCMDQTGMGEKPVEDAQRRHGSLRVEGVLFTIPNKLTLATSGREAFEDRRVRIPAARPALRADLHRLKKVPSETGAPRFMAERDEGGHADRTWAAFLGIHAAGGAVVPMEHHALGQPRESTKLADYLEG